MAASRQQKFVEEYLIDLCAKQAAIRAGYSAKTAEVQGCRLLTNVKVQSAIQSALAKRSAITEITAAAVLKRFWAIATANPNELIEQRRACCRFCFGIGGRFQRTVGEINRARAEWMAQIAAAGAATNLAPVPDFDLMGGAGYDAKLPPNPHCSECFGEGIGVTFPRDTRLLSESALALYAGVKVTKDGIEVKMHDQLAALLTVARHLGMMVEKHEHTGKDGKPISHETKVTHVLEEAEAYGPILERIRSRRIAPPVSQNGHSKPMDGAAANRPTNGTH